VSENIGINGLEFEIKSNAEEANKGLQALCDTLQKLKGITGKTGLSSLSKEPGELNKGGEESGADGVTRLAKALREIGTASQVKGLGRVYSRLRSISELNFSNLSAVPQAVSNIAAAAVPKINAPASPVPAAATAPITQSVIPNDAIADLTAATSRVSFFTSALTKLQGVLSSVRGGFTKFGAKLREIRDNFQKMHPAVTGITAKVNQFVKSIGRIAMYRVIRTLLSGIANAFKEGTNNLYQYSKALGGDFAESLDKIATSTKYLKNSFATLAAPLINALAPVLDMIIDKLVTAINLIAQFFAALSGKSA